MNKRNKYQKTSEAVEMFYFTISVTGLNGLILERMMMMITINFKTQVSAIFIKIPPLIDQYIISRMNLCLLLVLCEFLARLTLQP
jgi:hypothetical protein